MSHNIPVDIEPVQLTMLDGKDRTFILTAGGMNRLKKRFSVKTLPELLKLEDDVAVSILYEALTSKEDLTEPQFFELLPYHPQMIAKAVVALLSVSMPPADPIKAGEKPTPAEPALVN